MIYDGIYLFSYKCCVIDFMLMLLAFFVYALLILQFCLCNCCWFLFAILIPGLQNIETMLAQVGQVLKMEIEESKIVFVSVLCKLLLQLLQ